MNLKISKSKLKILKVIFIIALLSYFTINILTFIVYPYLQANYTYIRGEYNTPEEAVRDYPWGNIFMYALHKEDGNPLDCPVLAIKEFQINRLQTYDMNTNPNLTSYKVNAIVDCASNPIIPFYSYSQSVWQFVNVIKLADGKYKVDNFSTGG